MQQNKIIYQNSTSGEKSLTPPLMQGVFDLNVGIHFSSLKLMIHFILSPKIPFLSTTHVVSCLFMVRCEKDKDWKNHPMDKMGVRRSLYWCSKIYLLIKLETAQLLHRGTPSCVQVNIKFIKEAKIVKIFREIPFFRFGLEWITLNSSIGAKCCFPLLEK